MKLVQSLLWLLLAGVASSAQAKLVWHWQDDFSAAEQQKLESWLTKTHQAIEGYIGRYPFDIHLYMYRNQERDEHEPVPWAATRRSFRQGLEFYVEADYPLQDFLDDWTAPHEFAHLLIPYVGDQRAWFSEGFASYLQYQVMADMQMISRAELKRRLRYHLNRAKARYPFNGLSYSRAAPLLKRARQYPTLYWSGASYFLRVDMALRDQGDSLAALLGRYLECCRMPATSFDKLIFDLDRLAGFPVFSQQLSQQLNSTRFPDYEADLARW